MNTIRVSKGLDPDLGLNVLQRLSADDKWPQACNELSLYLIETPFNDFANRADPDQAAQELPDQGLLCLFKDIHV